jgi:hypothetical protein
VVAVFLLYCRGAPGVATIARSGYDQIDSQQDHSGDKVSLLAQWCAEFAASVRGLPDPAKIPPDRVDYIDVITEPGELVRQESSPTPELEFEPQIRPIQTKSQPIDKNAKVRSGGKQLRGATFRTD